jgi:hypothetical protein
VALKRAGFVEGSQSLLGFTSDSSSEGHVLGHDSDSLSVDGTKVGVLEETDEVGLRGFLESHDGGGLEAKVRLPLLGNFADESLEGELSDKKLSRLLVSSNFSESDGARSESVGLLDTSGRGRRLASGLGGELLAGSFSSSGFAGGLLGSSHDDFQCF